MWCQRLPKLSSLCFLLELHSPEAKDGERKEQQSGKSGVEVPGSLPQPISQTAEKDSSE